MCSLEREGERDKGKARARERESERERHAFDTVLHAVLLLPSLPGSWAHGHVPPHQPAGPGLEANPGPRAAQPCPAPRAALLRPVCGVGLASDNLAPLACLEMSSFKLFISSIPFKLYHEDL